MFVVLYCPIDGREQISLRTVRYIWGELWILGFPFFQEKRYSLRECVLHFEVEDFDLQILQIETVLLGRSVDPCSSLNWYSLDRVTLRSFGVTGGPVRPSSTV